jgi:hypothetical protein
MEVIGFSLPYGVVKQSLLTFSLSLSHFNINKGAHPKAYLQIKKVMAHDM